MGLEHATLGAIILLALLLAPVIYFIRYAQRGGELFVRRIRAVDAIDEASGRSAEMGRPVSFCTGLTPVGPLLYACLGVLHYVGGKSARHRSRLIVPQRDPEVMAICEDVLRDAYKEQGKLSHFEPRDIVFLSEEQFAFAAGYMGLVQRENVGGAYLMGAFAAESLILAEAGQQIGAMQIGGSVNIEQAAFFICTCDYTMIGEELYGASAYLTKEPVQLGSLYGQDRAKLLILVMIVVGVIIATLNSVLTSRGMPALPNLDALIMYRFW